MIKNTIYTVVLALFMVNTAFSQIATSYAESFDDIAAAGWTYVNNSDVVGTTEYFQGNPVVFAANSGAPEAYLATNFNATGGSVISNWAISPEFELLPGATFTYYTRTVTGNIFPDRSEFRLSAAGASVDVGMTPTSVGDFTELGIELNPGLAAGGYPDDWEMQSYTYNGPATTGRVAFRYTVTDAGPFGSNSNFIGFDDFTFEPGAEVEVVPTMGEWGLICLGILLMIFGVVAVQQRKSAIA